MERRIIFLFFLAFAPSLAFADSQFNSLKFGGLTPIAQYHFNEGSGGSTIDTAYRNPGTLTNTTWVEGKFGRALRFNVSGAVLGMPGVGFPSGSNAWTVSLWRRGISGKTGPGVLFYWGEGVAATTNKIVVIETLDVGGITILHYSNDFTYNTIKVSSASWDFIYATFSGGDPATECAAIVKNFVQTKECTTKTGVAVTFVTGQYTIGNDSSILNPDAECGCDIDDPRIFAGSDKFGPIWRAYWDGVRQGLQ